MDEHVEAGPGRQEQRVGCPDAVNGGAVVGDHMELLSFQVDLVVDVGADVGQPPQLGLTWPDRNGRVQLAVDGAMGGRADVEVLGPDRVSLDLEVLERDDVLGDVAQVRRKVLLQAVDDDDARHAPGDLRCGGVVRVRVVPVGAYRRVLGNWKE